MMNEHEVRARTRKAALMAEVVWKAMRQLNLTATELGDHLSSNDTGFWLQAAREAGVHPPSTETVLMVIELLKVREQVELEVGADPFVGL